MRYSLLVLSNIFWGRGFVHSVCVICKMDWRNPTRAWDSDRYAHVDFRILIPTPQIPHGNPTFKQIFEEGSQAKLRWGLVESLSGEPSRR